MWEALQQVLEISHGTVGSEASGIYVRMEALRVDRNSKKMPLVQYQDHNTLIKNATYWCQVILFFFHSEEAGQVPKYKFTDFVSRMKAPGPGSIGSYIMESTSSSWNRHHLLVNYF